MVPIKAAAIFMIHPVPLHLYHDHHVSMFFSLALTLPFVLPFRTDNRLLQKKQIDLQNKKKKSNQKKITGFQVLS